MCDDPCDALITKYARPKTVDAPLTLIFRIRHVACCWCFCIQRLPISHKWISATNRNINYPRGKAKYRWRSIEAHSKNGAITMLLSLSPITAANMSVMNNSDQITGVLPYLQDHELLTLDWWSFYCIVHSISAAIDNCFHHDLNLLDVFQSD